MHEFLEAAAIGELPEERWSFYHCPTDQEKQTDSHDREPGFPARSSLRRGMGRRLPRPIVSAVPSDLPIGFPHPFVKIKILAHHRVNGAWQTSRFFAS